MGDHQSHVEVRRRLRLLCGGASAGSLISILGQSHTETVAAKDFITGNLKEGFFCHTNSSEWEK